MRGSLLGLLGRVGRAARLTTTCPLHSVSVGGKRFIERENQFAHSVLRKSPFLRESLAAFPRDPPLPLSQDNGEADWSGCSHKELLDFFSSVSFRAKEKSTDFNNPAYDGMTGALVAAIDHLDDDQLESVLMSLSLWPMVDSIWKGNFHSLWKALDSACLKRWKQWPPEKVLRHIDLWYSLHLCRQSDFVFVAINKYAKKPQRLKPHQLVQLLFYFNVIRTLSQGIKMYEVEHRVNEFFEDLTIEEVGVVAMGFFKTQHKWHTEALVSSVMKKTHASIETIPEVSLACILKALRLSIGVGVWCKLPDFLHAVASQLPRLSLTCSVHIPLLTTQSQTFLPSLLDEISQKLISNLSSARLKEIEKVVYTLALFNYIPRVECDVLAAVTEELNREEREKELKEYPKTFVAILHYLALLERCPLNYLPTVLDMNFIRSTYGKTNYMIGREILSLDTCIELELKEYQGPRLPVEVRDYLSKRYSTYLPEEGRKMPKHSLFMLQVMKCVESLFGKEFYACTYILPNQSRADIVIRVEAEKIEPLPLPSEVSLRAPFVGGPVWAPRQNDGLQGVWVALVIGSKNLFSFNHRQRLNGESQMKLRHLSLLGYTPVVVSELDWPGPEAGARHLKSLIQSALLPRSLSS